MVTTAVQVKGMSVSRGNNEIVHDISFSVERGSFAVLSGPSGCGKSTILLAIQNLLKHEDEVTVSGEITVNGNIVDYSSQSEDKTALSGYLMQNVDAQIVNQTAEDELAFGMENLGVPLDVMRERVQKYAGMFSIDCSREVKHLSGGQKQRVLIAACMCAGHDILLLDEPFANLDRSGAEQLISIFKECCKNGTTILCVEHRLEKACRAADTLFWMEDGLLQEMHGEKIKEFVDEKARVLELSLDWNRNVDNSVLSLHGLDAYRGKRLVHSGLSIELSSGSTTLLLGENGSGKTTLMRVLCGLSPYRERRAEEFIYMDEDRRKRHSYRKLRQNVGMVFQNPVHQLFMKTVKEELLLRNPDEAAAERTMELFGISHLKDRHPYSLSMGEKRRVSVAAVTVSDAPLMLLDEPTIGQDYKSLHDMACSLRDLQEQRGTALLISTHDEQAVKLFGEKAVILS